MSDVGEVSVKITADASGVDRAISNVKGQFSQLSNDLTGIAKGFNLDNVASQIDKVSDKFKNIGSTLAISAAPFEIYGVLAVNAFADFEQGIAKINTLLPDATKAEMEAVGEQLKSFSSEFGADINDAIQAYYDALSAGVAQGDVLPFMETAQKAGVAGMSDVSVAVDGLTSILNSYQKKTSEAENVSDVMFKTVELGKIEFEQLAANIGKVAPTAAQFKIGFEDVGAAIASITSQGLKPEQTMTVLTSLISQLGKSGTDLSDKFKEITGQSFPDFIASGGTLADAIGKIRDYSQDTGTSLMDMTGNLEAAKGLAMLGGSAFEQYAGFLDEISDSAGATETAYSKMSETMAFAMDQLKAQMQTTLIEVGDALAPVVKDFTQWLSDNADEIKDFAVSVAENAVPAIEKLFDILKGLMDSFNNLSPDTKSLLSSVLGVGIAGAAIGGPALFGAGMAGSGLSGIVGSLSTLSKISLGGLGLSTVATDITALGTASAGAEGAVGLLAGTVGALAAAGAGLAIGAWVYDVGNFRDEVSKLPGDIAEIAGGLANVISGDSAGWSQAGRGAASLFVDGFNSGVELVKGSPEVISNIFADAIEATSLSFTGLVDGFYQAFKDQSNQTITVGKPDTSEYPQAGRDAAADFVKAANDFFSSNPITAPGVEAGKTVAEEINRINQQVVIDQNRWLSDDKAWHTFEGQLADALISSGKRVRTFSSQSEADIWNAANEWQEAFKKSGMGFEDWLNSLNSFDGQKFQKVAQDFSSTFGIEIQKVYEMFANQEIVPLKFDTSGFGNVYYEYQNGVYQPIMNNPVMIQVDEGTASGAFKSLVDQWMQVKAQIEANPANPKINVEGSRGNLQQAWENQNAINPDQSKWQYSNEEVKLNPITGKYEKVVQQASEAGTSEGAKQGVTQGLDKWLASHGKQPSDIDAILKSPTQTAAYQKLMEKELNKEWGSQKETSSGLSVGTKQVEANTEEVKSNTKGQEDLAQSFKSLDEAIAHIMTTDKSSFVYDGKKYGREQNDDGSYSWLDQSNTAKEQRAILEKQQKEAEKTSKNTEELGLQFQRGVSVQEAMLSAIQQYGGLNKAEGQKFTVGEDTYKIAIDSSGKILAQAVSATAKVAQGQQKAYDDLIKKQSDLNDKLIEKQGKLATKEIGSTEYKNLQTDINNLKNEIRLNKAEIDAQTKIVKDNTGTTTKLDAKQLKLIDSVDSTSKGIFEFSEPVKIAGESTEKLADGSDKATGALQIFADTLGSLDIKSIIQSWLGEGELGQAAQNKANDLTQLYGKDVSEQLTTGLATTISKELPKWVSWQKEGKGQSYDDVSKYKSDLWYEFANAVLKTNYAGYTDPGTRDWTFREGINSRLNPDTLKMTEELFAKSLEAYVKPFYEGKITAQPGTDYLGNQDIKNSSKYWSNDWKFVNDGLNETGTEAKTTIPQINTLNSAFEKIGLTGSGLSDVLSNVNTALSDHHANILESKDYLAKYNNAAGENVKYTKEQEGQTKDLMNSLGMLGTAQNMYNTYMQDGELDAKDAASVQQALSEATRLMGDAGIDANTNISGLPGALQALASAAQAAMSQIQAAISNANTVVQNAQTTAANIFKFGAPYTPGAMPESTLKFGNRINESNIMDPCSFYTNGQIFASGGPVTENGPAYLHQGEYVLRRDEVNRQTSGSPNVNLKIDMSNSRFGNAEMQKDLPKRIARETRRALARSGI